MRAVCAGDPAHCWSSHYDSAKCEAADLEAAEDHCLGPMRGLSRKLCDGKDHWPKLCPKLRGLFNHYGAYECGNVDGFQTYQYYQYCWETNMYVSGNGNPTYYAYCIKK